MRKIIWLTGLVTFATLALAACASSESNNEESTEKQSAPQKTQITDAGDSKILIAYFSKAGENVSVGDVEKGNTEIIAEMIADETGGDLFKIETAKSYPEDYDETTEVAQEEQQEEARPALAQDIDISQYDQIYLGYPNWWGDMPMALYTFLENKEFNGKTIMPFTTHEGSGLSNTVSSIENATGATVTEGLSIRGTTAQNSRNEAKSDVDSWLTKVQN